MSAPSLTVREVIDLYLKHLVARVAAGDFSQHALDDMRRELQAFSARFGEQSMDACRRHDLTSWLDDHPAWKSNHTKKRVLGCVIRPFLWAEEEELIDASPYRKSKKMKLRTRPRRPAEAAEYVLLMRCPSRPLRRALFFLRRSGARTCEMRELTWPEVHLDAGYIQFEEHKGTNLRDDSPPRVIGLEPVLVRFLRNLKRRAPAGQERVFLNCEGQPWHTRHVFDRHFRRWADRLGLKSDLKAYGLRHLYGTGAIEAGVGERQLADQMGHASTRMVSWYAHTARKQEHLKRVAAAALQRPKIVPGPGKTGVRPAGAGHLIDTTGDTAACGSHRKIPPGLLAQLARAPARHAGGQRFKSSTAQFESPRAARSRTRPLRPRVSPGVRSSPERVKAPTYASVRRRSTPPWGSSRPDTELYEQFVLRSSDLVRLFRTFSRKGAIMAGERKEKRTLTSWTPERIKQLRRSYGESQSAFAERLRVKVVTIQYWEQGRGIPSGLAEALLDRLSEDAQEGAIRPHPSLSAAVS